MVCLFGLQTVVAAEEGTAYDIRLHGGLKMRVEVCTDGIFRVRITPRETFSESLMERYHLIKTDWEAPEVSRRENENRFEVTTDSYRLTVDKQTGALTVSDRKGRTLLEKAWFRTAADPLCRDLGKVINERYKELKVASNSGIIGDDQNPAASKDTAETGDYRNTSILSFALKEGERFYGGGSTSRDHIQHRGELLRMWVTQPELFNIYNTTDEADFYLMFGRSMPEIIDDFTLITGRPYLLPKWAYGLCFGPNMLENQFDILRDAIGFREMGVPCDLFWLEPQWMEKRYDFSTKKKWNYKLFSAEAYWDSTRYPKKESHRLLIGRLHELGFHLGLWLCEEYDLSIAELRGV